MSDELESSWSPRLGLRVASTLAVDASVFPIRREWHLSGTPMTCVGGRSIYLP